MERAGAAAAAIARTMAGSGGPVWVLAGPGNNGGDGFVVARLLAEAFFDVVTVFRGDPARLPADAAAAHAALRAAGLGTTDALPTHRPALIVDALFGVGLKRAPGPRYAELIDAAAHCGAPVLSLDVPSGIDADTGVAFAPAMRADATTTFIALKPGLCTGDGLDYAGRVSLHTLGTAILDGDAAGRLLDWQTLAADLPQSLRRRSRNVHKGTFGTLAIVGGGDGMVGALLLAGRAALKTGAGKVRIGFAARNAPAVDWAAPELMLGDAAFALDAGANALVVGPGLGSGSEAREIVGRALEASVPLVLDADALNAIAGDASLRTRVRARRAPTLATPHPAEAARLLGATSADVNADRLGSARALTDALRAHVVLKGAGSIIVDPLGAFAINAAGGPALATGGTGDVLAGMLGALLAQGISADCALRLAVCLHGAAADRWVEQHGGPVGLAASDLADAARDLLNAAATSGG